MTAPYAALPFDVLKYNLKHFYVSIMVIGL